VASGLALWRYLWKKICYACGGAYNPLQPLAFVTGEKKELKNQ